MKKLLSSPLLKHALVGCMAFSYWIDITQISVLFFGEYPYPKEEDFIS